LDCGFCSKKNKGLLEEYGLEVHVMTIGSTGLHGFSTIECEYKLNRVEKFAKIIADTIVNKYPNEFITEITYVKNEKIVLIDNRKNAYGETIMH